MMSSEPPRPRTSSSPFSPASSSPLSVPKSRPPFGQPARSLVVKRTGRFTFVFCVPSHRASSEAVAWGERPCSSFLEVSASTLEASAIRRTAHPIRKATTKAISCTWRTTAPSPSLACVSCYLHLQACHTTKPGASLRKPMYRSAWKGYCANFAQTAFSEVRLAPVELL
jgi:hypothetical protein